MTQGEPQSSVCFTCRAQVHQVRTYPSRSPVALDVAPLEEPLDGLEDVYALTGAEALFVRAAVEFEVRRGSSVEEAVALLRRAYTWHALHRCRTEPLEEVA